MSTKTATKPTLTLVSNVSGYDVLVQRWTTATALTCVMFALPTPMAVSSAAKAWHLAEAARLRLIHEMIH